MDESYIGEIKLFAGNFAPIGWLFCDGSLLLIKDYEVLFDLLGTTYGGDGVTNFALPDLRSRVALGQSELFPIGQKAGMETIQLKLDELPRHSHTPACSTSGIANTKDATNAFWSAAPAGGRRYGSDKGDISSKLGLDSVEKVGSSVPHENRMPILAMSYIMAVEGVFPSKS
ncbi:phage tail protein [Dyadobacter sp. 22481]|uniref:phage tail protein n=1 Tax=Dyadobacter sp. 22481 TaxID=3453926 RepID=UPI003F8326B9